MDSLFIILGVFVVVVLIVFDHFSRGGGGAWKRVHLFLEAE